MVIGSLTAGYLTTPVYAAAKAYFPIIADDPSSEHAIGFRVGLTPDTVATIIGLVTPVLVWAIPNKKAA